MLPRNFCHPGCGSDGSSWSGGSGRSGRSGWFGGSDRSYESAWLGGSCWSCVPILTLSGYFRAIS